MAVSASIAGICACLAIAWAANPLIDRVSALPTPLGHLLIGMAAAAAWPHLSPSIPGSETSTATQAAMSILTGGLGLLVVFSAGLALPFEHLRERWREVSKASLAKLLPPLLFLPPLALLLWPDAGMGAVVAGLALSEVSVAISWSMLDTHRRIETSLAKDLLGVTFLVNSTIVLLVLAVLRTPIVLLTLLAFCSGIALHDRIPSGARVHLQTLMRAAIAPSFFVLAGARIEWSAIADSWNWLVLLAAAAASRLPLPWLGAGHILGHGPSDATYFEVLATSRLTFAALIVWLGVEAGTMSTALLSEVTIIVSLLSASSASVAHYLHLRSQPQFT
ncbi:MAG: hypothetical protein QF760_01370 [Candidatus Thalassarchaeaceae archaeon]|nr:hypothetical protein [Candidatus Thalassarchaeaceae archaeon]MDP6703163.1 hypothetical protein [Candidatus Thalassarchaeaceae archaeon]MDP7003808.1 hypothetical protein [Candidatus Thalassarchaeaceae archaeon]